MELKSEKELRLKNVKVFPKGTLFDVIPCQDDRVCLIKPSQTEQYRVRYISIFRAPSMATLQRWLYDAIAQTPAGEDTECDGTDEHGFPAWPRILGFI